MKYIALILAVAFLHACSGSKETKGKVRHQRNFTHNKKEEVDFQKKANQFCKPCGGLRAALLHNTGIIIKCADGGGVEVNWSEEPKSLILGKCK